MKVDFFWHPYKYLPYEKRLAERELTILFGNLPVSHPSGFTVEVDGQVWEDIADRVTYFREAVAENGDRVIPQQVLLEASANGNAQESLIGLKVAPSLKRQSTRYSAHGIHEYRGKFNPQIVRAIGNLLNLSLGDWIFDPFCGSGTTLLEAVHSGWNAVGMDINPLAVEIAKAKLAAFRVSPDNLHLLSIRISENLNRFANLSFDLPFDNRQMTQIGGVDWEAILPNLDYLQAWFTESVLVQLSRILRAIAEIPDPNIKSIFRVILSNIVRKVSLQEPADLRIRRRKSPPQNMPAIPMFVNSLTSYIKSLLNALRCIQTTPVNTQQVILGDVRDAVSVIGKAFSCQGFDAAITSPPYVSALPYIDTQRLSLVVLGLIDAADIRKTEQRLIGNREITNRHRKSWEAALRENQHGLPSTCWQFCRELAAAIDPEKDGFRRQNMPALVYQYFSEMSQMFAQVRNLLRPSARFVLVLGPNRTNLGKRQFVINTPHWLGILAEQRSFRQVETLQLDTYQRYDVHKANSIRKETLLILETIPNASRSHSTD